MKDKRKQILIGLLCIIVASILGISSFYWYQSVNYISTEDARITGDLIKITSRGSGKLVDIDMEEGDWVIKDQILGRQEIENKNAEKTIIRAPQKGVIIKEQANIGEFYNPGQVLGYIVNPEKLYVSANIEETKIGKVKEGQIVDISIDEFDGIKFKGKVEFVGLAANSSFSLLPSSSSGSFTKIVQRIPVKISIEDQGYKILPGTNVVVKIHLKN
ncbi:efflux RND transporter periplasmic adaptor subunit [Tepidibacter aestuarii]|uniref:efflux RND transporter periplasmic adaptor subunit n=1 Tax=Tepidibacter aestuarii TaxID=2925782 RepID=UPI0020C120D6|nr:efflux RND transporter periplasmic adaptor subunit [Tepidibacter aestuarii]CAH2213548.1 Hemolysin D [Tepidibacter aestuarii]